MIKIGKAPYLECSTKGDKRFSAFCAFPKCLKGSSIEQAYQRAKIFANGTTGLNWCEAKGKQAVNQDNLAILYRAWWKDWVKERNLLPVLRESSGLSDMFGQVGHICQAIVLWEIRNEK